MRLIDADELIDYFEGLARSLVNARCFNAADAIQGAAEKLRNAPTVDADEYFDAVDRIKPCPKCRYQIFGSESARRGEWAHLGVDEWCCTSCGEVIHTEGSWEKPTRKYCHECGAKMDLEV